MSALLRADAPASTIIPTPQLLARYCARCDVCDYTGPERGSSLTALHDFDQHVATNGHAVNRMVAANMVDREGDDA